MGGIEPFLDAKFMELVVAHLARQGREALVSRVDKVVADVAVLNPF